MNVEELIADRPRLHLVNGELSSAWKLSDEELRWLDQRLKPSMSTLETGAGVSTVVFALKETQHRCIVPDPGEAERIREYCDRHSISHRNVEFILEPSETALPRLAGEIDVALIDGRHAFPTPFLDWFYIARLLRVHGILIIDDLHIWTCEALFRFLLSEPDWRLTAESLGAAAFEKTGDGFQDREWHKQPFVSSQGRQGSVRGKLRYLTGLLRRGNLRLFGHTLRLGVASVLAGHAGRRSRR